MQYLKSLMCITMTFSLFSNNYCNHWLLTKSYSVRSVRMAMQIIHHFLYVWEVCLCLCVSGASNRLNIFFGSLLLRKEWNSPILLSYFLLVFLEPFRIGFLGNCKCKVSWVVNPLASDLSNSRISSTFRCCLYCKFIMPFFFFYIFFCMRLFVLKYAAYILPQ